MLNSPNISIIIPTYNRAHLLTNVIDSIQAQTYREWECFVVDDFSTDNTKDLIQSLIETDNRIRYIVNERTKGAQGARNTGLIHAEGDFICFFDSDDIMYPNHLEQKVRFFNQIPEIDIVTSFSHILNSESRIHGTFCWITEGNIHRNILERKSYVDTNSALMKSHVLRNYGMLDENCPSYQEWDLHIILSKTATYSFIPEFLTGYCQRNSDTISSDKKRDLLGRLFIYSKHRDEFIKNLGIEYYSKRCMELFGECRIYNIVPRNHMNWSQVEERIMKKYKRRQLIGKIKRVLKL